MQNSYHGQQGKECCSHEFQTEEKEKKKTTERRGAGAGGRGRREINGRGRKMEHYTFEWSEENSYN